MFYQGKKVTCAGLTYKSTKSWDKREEEYPADLQLLHIFQEMLTGNSRVCVHFVRTSSRKHTKSNQLRTYLRCTKVQLLGIKEKPQSNHRFLGTRIHSQWNVQMKCFLDQKYLLV